MTNEKILLRQGDVVVTPTRLMVGAKTYAIRNVVSTQGLEIRPGCLGRLFGKKAEFQVIITTTAGRITAYTSHDDELIGHLLEALDLAISGRE